MTNYLKVVATIAEVARNCGRDSFDITLVAVSKGYSLESVKKVYKCGCRDFGESRVQEALAKIENSPKDVRWHMIGNLQKNKVRKAVGVFQMIHSVDSFDLAEKISAVSVEKGVTTSILLECNVSGEETKRGFSPEKLRQTYGAVVKLPNITVEGLMTMAPLTENREIIRTTFSGLHALRGELGLHHLSMGMSSDYQIAIEEGATILRIGRAIFDLC